MKGQVTLLPLVLSGGITLLTAVSAAWITAGKAASTESAALNTKVEVVKITEELHYKELSKQLEGLKTDLKEQNAKIDAIIQALQIKVR